MATHLEYITDRKFNSSFKNMLRDYYTYGFKDSHDYTYSYPTYNNDRERLNDFLKDYMEWSKQKNINSPTSARKNVTFITCDSQSMSINPFHRVYRFCGTDREGYLYCFFHTIAALNSLFQLSDGTDTLGLSGKAAEKLERKLNVQENKINKVIRSMHISQDVKDRIGQYYNDEEQLIEAAKTEFAFSDEQILQLRTVIRDSTIQLKTSELVKFYSPKCLADDSCNPNKANIESVKRTANNRLQRLNNIGIICCSQKGTEYAFSDEQIEQFMASIPDKVRSLLDKEDMTKVLKKALENHATVKPGDRNWYLSELTVKKILEVGRTANNQFKNHLQYALDFYSKTFMFGEIGTFLLDRIGVNLDSPIRIKHEYYMHSLNDFNAIDLMSAIENKKWCLISYNRENLETKLLCYPMQLRISSVTGREYLMYYEPFKKSCSALRLEFIESIEYYNDCNVKQCMSQYCFDSDSEIDRNLSRARLLLDYTWGVSTGTEQVRNIENLNAMFRELSIRIEYNKNSDHYILDRLYRESRIGMICVNEEKGFIDFKVVAADLNEIIPFIRSFYSRIISCTGFDEEGFSIERDINHICARNVYDDIDNKQTKVKSGDDVWCVDEKFLKLLGDGTKASAHEKLFNEIFSVYYHIFAAIFCKICDGVQNYTKKEINTLCHKIMLEYKDKCGVDMLWFAFKEGEAFVDLLINGGFLLKEELHGEITYRSKYITPSAVDLYADVIPLSEIEVRWLSTIIRDEKIHYFLDEKEIVALKLLLADMAIDIKPFPMNVVNYYDRYKFSSKKEWKESSVILPVLDAISNEHVVKIEYVSRKGNVVSGNYKPILIEFSKRDNCFKGYFLSCRRKEGFKLYNLSQCISIEDTGNTYNYAEIKTHFDCYREQQMDKVELEFEDRLNLADRILTEFSPWKKYCVFDSESGIYHLTIYYQKQDGKEMANRLLGFGKNVRLIDSSHRLAIIIQSKLRDQMVRVRSRERRDIAR